MNSFTVFNKLEKIRGWYNYQGEKLPKDICNPDLLNSIMQKSKQMLIDDFNPRGYTEEGAHKVLTKIREGWGYYFLDSLMNDTIIQFDMESGVDDFDHPERNYESIPKVNNPFDYYKVLPIAGVCADNGGGIPDTHIFKNYKEWKKDNTRGDYYSLDKTTIKK